MHFAPWIYCCEPGGVEIKERDEEKQRAKKGCA
jgi:hypothetical protein